MKWSGKRVLVTGAAGFIGHHLVKRLTKLNAEIIAVDNFSLGVKRNLSFFEGEILCMDVSAKDFIISIKGDIDYIFHFGAPSSVILFKEDYEKMFRETISGFINIMELAKSKAVTKVIYPSSGSVYGRTPPPHSEMSIPQPVNLYGIAKLTCEMIAEFYRDAINSVGLRIFAGYGPGEEHKGNIASPITLFLRAIMRNKRPVVFGDGTQSRDFIYIDDIIKAIIRAAERETPPIINVGSGKSYNFNYVIKLINELLEKDIKPIYVPRPRNYLERTQADITLMKRFLEINPIGLEDGLNRYLKVIGLR